MKKLFLTFLSFHCLLFTVHCVAQDQHLIDSLQFQLKNHDARKLELHLKSSSLYDTAAANILDELSYAYWGVDPYKAMEYAEQCLALSKKIGYKKGIGHAYYSLGVINQLKGDYLNSIELLKKGLKYYKEINNKEFIASTYNGIGNCYNYIGNYSLALNNYFSCLKTMEEIGNKIAIADSYNNIGVIYSTQNNFSEALKYHLAALKNRKEIKYEIGIADSQNNIGIIYCEQNKYDQALTIFFDVLKIREKTGDKVGIASTHNNIGLAYLEQSNFAEALNNFFAALIAEEEIEDKQGISKSYINIGNSYRKEKKYHVASEYLNKGLSLAKEIGSLDNIKSSYKGLAKLDSTQGNFNKAFEHYKLYIAYRDSLVNEENTKKIVQTQMQYDFDKRQVADSLKFEKEKEVGALILQRQKAISYTGIAGFLIVLVFAVFIFRSLGIRNKQNKIIAEQKSVVEEKQKEITDCILYAKRIQFSLLAHQEVLQNNLNEHFVLFKPKDIVSGDFYWAVKKEDSFYLGVCDSTGHGVPGAFMSLLNINYLNEAVI